MDKILFEHRYTNLSGMSLAEYHAHFVTLPCSCGDHICDGWAAVENTPHGIDLHQRKQAMKE